jgi:SAM-dependent methyltransferase
MDWRMETRNAVELWRYQRDNAQRHAEHDYRQVFKTVLQDLAPFGVSSLADLNVLDLGCGQRFPFSLLCAAEEAHVTALDVSWVEPGLSAKGIVRTLRTSGPKRALKSVTRQVIFDPKYYGRLSALSGASRKDAHRIHFVWTDPDSSVYPLPSARFDLVVSIAVLEHVRDVHAVAREVARVLKPGGIFYAFIHNYYSLSGGHRLEWAYPDTHPSQDVPPWDHLRSRRYPPDYFLNELRPEEYREAIGEVLEIELFEGRGESHEPGVLEGERFLVGPAAVELAEYPRDLLLTRSWCVVAHKPEP